MRTPGTNDYTTMSKDGKKPKKGPVAEDTRRQWWRLEGKDCAKSVGATIDTLAKAQGARLRNMVINARLYGNLSMSGGSTSAFSRLMQQTATKDKASYNAIQEIIDTLGARVGETKPRPYFLTSGGNYKEQRKAKRLNQFEEGNFYENKTYDKGGESFRDGQIQGDGFVYVYGRAGRIKHERVMPSELWVDEVEAQYGYPRNMHRLKEVDRDELAEYFPDSRKEIMEANGTLSSTGSVHRATSTSDMVSVSESWHLGAENEDGEFVGGKRCITLAGQHMLMEPEDYTLPMFPFARFSWCRRPSGFWSQGLCEQLASDQIELNAELSLIQRSMRLAGVIQWLIQNGSKIVKSSINNDIGNIITYAGSMKPEAIIPEPIHPVFFQNTALIIERMRDRSGVSQMSAAGRKPAGLNSGVAIREIEDIESDRHRSISRANDNLYLGIAALDIAVAGQLAKEGKLYPVRVPGKNKFRSVDWKKEIGSIDADQVVMQCFPVSRLPRDPSGRLQTIQEYVQAGFLTPRQGRHALDFPDIDSIESLQNAQEDILTDTLDAMVDEGDYRPPEPTDDLGMAKKMVVEYIQRYRSLELEPEKLEMLRRFSSQVDMLQQRAQAAMMPPPGMAPQAAPAAQPVSDLVQNVPGAAA